MPGGMAVEDDWDAAGPTFSPQLEQPQRQQRKVPYVFDWMDCMFHTVGAAAGGDA